MAQNIEYKLPSVSTKQYGSMLCDSSLIQGHEHD